MVCDGPACDALLYVDANGDDANGESAAWVKVHTTWGRYDLCTRACAVALMDDPDFVGRHDAEAEAIAAVAVLIRDDGAPGAVEGGDGG